MTKGFWLAAFAVLAMAGAGYLYMAERADVRVVDEAGLMTASQLARLNEYHRFLLRDHDIDYRVITTRDGKDINEYTWRAFEASKTGGASTAGRGLLLVINAEQNRVRMEVGPGLEGVYPDAFVAYLEQRQMTPFFAAGRVADGILATSEMIITRAQNARANAGFGGEAWAAASTGAGATASARLHAGRDESFRAGPEVAAQATPEGTLSAYFTALANRNGSPELDVYTPEARTFLAQQVLTAAQMDNTVRAFRDCTAEPARLSADGSLAVIRYPLAQRQCSPWFLRRGDDGLWRLDLATMAHVIRFGRNNAWRFYTKRHPYHYAFRDVAFDSYGHPQPVRWGVGYGDRAEGVVVNEIDEGSAAERLGMRVGDVLRSWNGEAIRDHRHLNWMMGRTDPGAEITLDLDRVGKKMTVTGTAPPRVE